MCKVKVVSSLDIVPARVAVESPDPVSLRPRAKYSFIARLQSNRGNPPELFRVEENQAVKFHLVIASRA